MTRKPLDLSRYTKQGEGAPPRTTAFDALVAAAPSEVAQVAQEMGVPMRHVPTTQIAPDPHQLRRLPHPDDVRQLAGRGNRAAAAILEELCALGQSMKEQGQLQPLIVYPDQGDPRFPLMTHRIIMGQRRWSAAILLELPTLWVAEFERPSEVDRILRQFDENEQRTGLTDMERAWALQTLKDAVEHEQGSSVPWGVIEERMKLSTQRRQDLLRLLRFDEEGQNFIKWHRWSEWTLRDLHMAINAGDIHQASATAMLRQLAMQQEVNATIVRHYVELHHRQRAAQQYEDGQAASAHVGADTADAGATSAPRTSAALAVVPKQLNKFRKGIERLTGQISPDMEQEIKDAALREIEGLTESLEALLLKIKG